MVGGACTKWSPCFVVRLGYSICPSPKQTAAGQVTLLFVMYRVVRRRPGWVTEQALRSLIWITLRAGAGGAALTSSL